MKTAISLAIMSLLTFCLSAQDITISFQLKVAGNQIDSIWVTNLKTDQKVKLMGNESLVLSQSTGIKSLTHLNERGYLYPNPCYGDASLVFSTSVNQEVEVRISNISGQIVGLIRQKLTPGQHTFMVKFPVIGLYAVSVLKDDGPLSFKAVYSGVQMQECKIEYAGSGSPEHMKSAVVEKTLSYKQGDILHYSVSSGKNNTIITDSPSASKVYSVDFYECIDFDKNYYKIVKIDSQVWMAENLKTTKYRDGAGIPNVTDNATWHSLSSGAYCWYNNDAGNKATYGALYNWYAVNTGKLCPAGWHVPTDAEWTSLSTYLGGESVAGGKMKETGTAHWLSPNTGATNESGFSGLPDGSRLSSGSFPSVGSYGSWWSSSEFSTNYAWCRALGYDSPVVYRSGGYEGGGFSVRCLRD